MEQGPKMPKVPEGNPDIRNELQLERLKDSMPESAHTVLRALGLSVNRAEFLKAVELINELTGAHYADQPVIVSREESGQEHMPSVLDFGPDRIVEWKREANGMPVFRAV